MVSFCFSHVSVHFCQHHVLKTAFVPSYPLLSFAVDCPHSRGFISGLSVLFRSSLCQFLCQHQAVLITIVLLYSLVLGSVIPPILFLFSMILFIFREGEAKGRDREICETSILYPSTVD